MTKAKIGAQLIIWGKRAIEDLPSVLDEASSLGYAGIETGPNAFEKVSNPKRLLEAKDLKLAGLHTGVGSLDEKSADIALDLLQKMDGRFLLYSSAGGKENSEENYRKSAKFLEKVGQKSAKIGVKVCYHNHFQEIINNAMGMKIICEETSPEFVSLCVDTYWVKCGGLSPAAFIKENLNRVEYLHLKDGTEEGMKKHEFLELGKGIVDFASVFKAVKSKNIEWFVVEQDRTDGIPQKSMDISRKYLKEKFGL